ncbi:MAG: BON domain-containing protein [Pirellulaceae bacterium]|nr:BON domain-containing protein [Pirellulaceae bacterium]
MSARIENSIQPEDLELARRVKLFLASQPRPALRYLQVEANGSTVTLRGLVTTFYERQLAIQSSRRVAGVRKLVDEIVVQEIAPLPRADFTRVALRSEQPLAAV